MHGKTHTHAHTRTRAHLTHKAKIFQREDALTYIHAISIFDLYERKDRVQKSDPGTVFKKNNKLKMSKQRKTKKGIYIGIIY